VSYEEFLNQNIFKPIGMKDTYCRINTSGNPIIKNKAYGYERNGSFVNAKYLDMAQPYSAGAILSSVDDLNKWNTALINDKLLRKETLAKAFFNYKLNNGENDNYGYGFLQNEIQGSPTIEHGGGIPGYASNAIYFPEEKVYVVILSNCRNNDPAYVSIQIGALVVGKPIDEKQPLILSSDEIKKYEGKYLNLKDSTSYLVFSDKGVLSLQRAEGGRRTTLVPYEKNKFFVQDSYNEYLFVPNQKSIYELIIKNRRRMQIEKCIKD
jgi:CubicO group peptidase (beta-lactamase class C family)